jgi:hypothetical protein
MKQFSNYICFGIEPSEICSFVKIAIDAGKGEIVDIVTTAVNFRNDVLNVQHGKRGIILMQMTVFASVLSTLADRALICAPIIYDVRRSAALVVLEWRRTYSPARNPRIRPVRLP